MSAMTFLSRGVPIEPSKKSVALAAYAKVAESDDDSSLRHVDKEIRPQQRSRISRLLNRRYWTTEILALLGSTAVMVIVVVILREYDGEEFSAWRAPITLNALLSLFITIFYMLLTAVISSCLSQLKWVHFNTPSALRDFHVYDKASRGWVGAFVLMFRLKKVPSLPTFLAVILTLPLGAIGPLTQQVIGLEQIENPVDATARMPVSHSFGAKSAFSPNYFRPYYRPEVKTVKGGVFADLAVDFNISAAATAGMFSLLGTSNFDVSTGCVTGNCTWDPYATLAVRSQCANITERLKCVPPANASAWFEYEFTHPAGVSFNNATYPTPLCEIPGGAFAPVRDTYNFIVANGDEDRDGNHDEWQVNVVWGASTNNVSLESPFQISNATLARYQLIYLEMAVGINYNKTDFESSQVKFGSAVAYECMIDAVVQPMKATLTTGTLKEEAVGDPVVYPPNPASYEPQSEQDFYHWKTSAKALEYSWGDQHFTLNPNSTLSLSSSLFSRFGGYSMATGWPSQGDDATIGTNVSSEEMDMVHSRLAQSVIPKPSSSSPSDHDSSSGPVSAFFGTMAKSLTSYMRQADSDDHAPGTSMSTKVVFAVRWGWIAVPAVTLALTALLTAATIVTTRHQRLPAWSDSSLATMMHGVDADTRSRLADIHEVRELDRASKNVWVRLQGDDLSLRPSKG